MALTIAVALAAAPVASAAWQQSEASESQLMRFSVAVDPGPPQATAYQLEVSPDGRYIAYQANLGDGWRLYMRPLDQADANPIPGPGVVGYFPDFSPNGEWILYGERGEIWKVRSGGGDPIRVYRGNPWKTWESDDYIMISRGANGLWRVPANGGERELVVEIATTRGFTAYQHPRVLPGGGAAVVELRYGGGAPTAGVGVVSFETGEVKVIAERGNNPQYAHSGHILYVEENALKAVPFTLERLEATGPAVTVLDGVRIYPNGRAEYSISDNGLLAYIPGRSHMARGNLRNLVWVDRAGNETPVDNGARSYNVVRLSPDGSLIAAEVGNQLWLYDLFDHTWATFAQGGANNSALWAPDGGALLYSTLAGGRPAVINKKSIGSTGEPEEVLATAGNVYAQSWSGDNTELLLHEMVEQTPNQRRILVMPLEGDRTARSILDASGDLDQRSPRISPDGRWLAYVSGGTGNDEVYLTRFPELDETIAVSEGGGWEPEWGGDSTELFYRNGVDMMVARLTSDPGPQVINREALFAESDYFSMLNRARTAYDYDPRSDRFLMSRWLNTEDAADIQVMLNFFELLNRVAPPERQP